MVQTLPRFLVNGVPVNAINCQDRGLHYGDGVFETIAIMAGKAQFWQAHMARLTQGCQRLGICAPTERQLLSQVDQLARNSQQAVIKLIVTRGSGGRGYTPAADSHPNCIIGLYPWPSYPAIYAKSGVNIIFCQTPLSRNRLLAGIKHLNRLEQVMAAQEVQQQNALEGLMSDDRGYIIEGTRSNLFVVKNGQIFTPKLSECGVAGIIRGIIIQHAEVLSLPVHIGTLSKQQVLAADEIFLSNSIIGIWPVANCEHQHFQMGSICKIFINYLNNMK